MKTEKKSFLKKAKKKTNKWAKRLQLYLSLVAGFATVCLFLIALTGLDRMFDPHKKCLDGVYYWKFALSIALAYDAKGKPQQCKLYADPKSR